MGLWRGTAFQTEAQQNRLTIMLWLRCAGISPNGYADLAAVIADSDAKTILCDNLNALRYMVRSDSTIMSAVLASSDWIVALDSSQPMQYTRQQ